MFHHVINYERVSIALRSSSELLYKSTKNKIICHMEYQGPLNVIINVSNIEYFKLHAFLTNLLMPPWWWWQKWSIRVEINNMWWNIFYTYAFLDFM